MTDKDDNVESRSSSLGIISDFLSSFTSVGSSNSEEEDTESNAVEITDPSPRQETLTDSEKNTTDVESGGSGGTTDDDDLVERRQSSLERITDFLSSFSSSGSADDPSSESKTADEDANDSVQQIQESSDFADKGEADKGDIAEDSALEMHRQSSLEKISDFLSSFTSLGSSPTETTNDNNNNETDEDNASKAQQDDENSENEDVILVDEDSEGTISEGRLRSSSSRIFTEPESIDKKDLDYVTLVSS